MSLYLFITKKCLINFIVDYNIMPFQRILIKVKYDSKKIYLIKANLMNESRLFDYLDEQNKVSW